MDIAGDPPEHKPRERETVFLMAKVVATPGEAPARYVVRNLSTTGACIAEPMGLRKGDRLSLSIGRLQKVAAQVAWTDRGFAGLRFLQPIDLALARMPRVKSSTDRTGGLKAGWASELRAPHQRARG